ncbi:MAG: ribonuclease HIII [Candidatus Aegiribacteria sp.]|nr:ribonuclease HIII [Candidatus Aegiribacteria sp.]
MIPGGELSQLVDSAAEKLEKSGITATDRRILANGIRITFIKNNRSCGINFYYSSKKGFSVVPSGGDVDLSQRIKDILPSDSSSLPDGTWTGSDEAGKGDYMGPLTVAAVYVDRRQAEQYRSIGITDSKQLSNDSVRGYAERIRSSSGGCFSIVSLPPLDYNRRFTVLSGRGKNSLDLLAECHAEAITELLRKTPEPVRVIIDKFCNEKRIAYLLPEGDYMLDLRIRGESDPAVAAASILARDAYLDGLDRISHKFGITALSGAGEKTDMACREFVREFGPDVLDEIAKIHFRNTLKVLSLFG